MTEKVDYKAMTLEDLQVAHSELCAVAHDAGVMVPEALTVDFDAQEAGANICRQLRNLLDDNKVVLNEHGMAEQGLAEGAKKAQDAQTTKTSRARKPKAKKAATAAKPADAKGAAQQEVKMTKTAKKTKAKGAKKSTAKKSSPKKTGAKKASPKNGAARKSRAPKGTGPVAEVIKMLKSAKGCTRAQVLAKTKWKAVSMQQIAEGAGLKLKVDESKRPFNYKAA